MTRLTKKGAKEVTSRLDQIANDMQENHEAWGIPEKLATDFAYRCDLLSDFMEKRAGIEKEALTEYDPVDEPKVQGGEDPEQIGEEKGGPERQDADEPYMKGEFTQQENRELREDQQGGALGAPKTKMEPQTPTPGRQAGDLDKSIDRLTKQACDAQLSTLGTLEDDLKIAAAQLKLAGGAGGVAGGVGKLAGAVGKARDSLITANAHGFAGPIVIDESERLAAAVNEVLPYISTLSDSLKESKTSSSPTVQLQNQEIVEQSKDRIGRLIDLAVKIADDCGKKIAASVTALTKEEKAADAE
jgi:hypothetical protein